MAFLGPEKRWLSSRSSRSTLRTEPEHAPVNIDDVGSGLRPHDKLFACPYLKRDPEEYGERQSCSRSGWTTVHGLRYALLLGVFWSD